MARTESISGTVLAVAASARSEDLFAGSALAASGLSCERVSDPDDAIARVQRGDRFDVILLAPPLEDPIRIAQRLHSLDRAGAIVLLPVANAEAELRRALARAPFLEGDVAVARSSSRTALAHELADAAGRTRTRREAAAERAQRRATPPPLSASYLGTLLDNVPIGVVTIDAEACVIGWNKRAGEMLGVPEVEVLGTRFAELLDDGDSSRFADLLERFGSSGIVDDSPELFQRGGRTFEITGARFSIRSGGTGSLLILQDVTSREAAVRDLRLQKALSDAQAESALAGIVVITDDGALQRVNRRFGEIWGISTEAMHDDPLAARALLLEQVEDPQAFMRGIDALAAGESFSDELRLKHGRTIERYAAHVADEQGRPVGQIWFHTDISARKREEESLRFLADATNLLSSSLEYETTLQRVADLVVPRVADWCTVDIAVADGTHTVAIAHCDPEKVELAREFRALYPDTLSSAVPTVIRTGESQLYEELTEEAVVALARDPDHLRLLRELELRSVMVVPIKVRDRVFGAINFISSQRGRCYGDDDLRLAEELARRAAIAIDNSRVHAELRATARTLQESLLPPHLPGVRGLELAARFRPAGVGMEVGGDFYDIFDTRGNEWAVLVGDVCGKGAEAAALTALTRYTVRTAAMYERRPSGILRVLNEALMHQRRDFRFTTLAFCLVDLERLRLRAAAGGHPRPILVRGSGSVESVAARGPLLGVMPDAKFGDEDVQLAPGDAIVLYTDGLTDALAPEQILDEPQLFEILGDCGGVSANEIAQRLEQRALGDDPARVPRDDIAIVVAKLSV